ncbi:hypothetical protein WJX77_003468 [Trebouxia sp. C0004]
MALLRGELSASAGAAVTQWLRNAGFEVTCLERASSADSSLAQGCDGLLALRSAPDHSEATASEDDKDRLGLQSSFYDDLMATAHQLQAQQVGPDVQAKIQAKRKASQALKDIQVHLDHTRQMQAEGLLSKDCCSAVTSELNQRLTDAQSQLDTLQRQIAELHDPLQTEKDAMMLVLKTIAEGCHRKRRRVQ